MRLRAAVTGCGAISALGRGVPETVESLFAGLARPPSSHRVPSTLRVRPPVFCVDDRLEEGFDPILSRTSRLALVAAREALGAAWGGRPSVDPSRVGVCLGTTVGCAFNEEGFYRAYHRGEAPSADPIRAYLANDAASVVAADAGARGPATTVVNACASGTDAIGLGALWLEAGLCDVVLAGGADALARYPYLGFAVLQNTSDEPCRPFDLHRKGLNLGEGAAVLVLERDEDARRRGAPVLALLAAYASASDAHHLTRPHPEGIGLRRAITTALRDARLGAEEVGFVNAHGTGTIENDRVEGTALADLFGQSVAVFSTKGYTGHALGAAGAIEAVLCVECLRRSTVPRNVGFETPDPQCRIVPTTETRRLEARAAVSTSLAFGGANAALVLLAGATR